MHADSLRHSQANSRYLNERRRLGTERDSKKVWHKIAKKPHFGKKESQALLNKNLLFAARIREYFGCISYLRPYQTFEGHCRW